MSLAETPGEDSGILYHITPVAAPRMTRADVWKKRPVVLRYRAFRDELRALRIDLPIPYKVVFYIPMPPSWSKRKRAEMHLQPHCSTPDKDNYEKGFLDALFDDDSHVWSGWAEKRWSFTPGIEITPLQALGRPQ